MYRVFAAALAVTAVCAPAPALAESPRELLLKAAFAARDKNAALAQIDTALKGAEAQLARNPKDREAQLQRAVAISYRGKLRRSRADLLTARRDFEAIVAADPKNAEAQMALGGWHLGAVIELGPLVARTALGARKPVGLQAMQRAIALGGGRAMFPAFASLTHIGLDSDDVAGARRLAEAAVKGRIAAPIDQVMQRQAAAFLKALEPGNGKAAAKTAKQLLPFGRIAK